MAQVGVLGAAISVWVGASPARADEPPATSTDAPYHAWHSDRPHSPPRPLALGAAPPPERPQLEEARRPLELAPELSLGFADCAEGTASNARCQGLSAGLGAGGSVLWRVSPYFGFGGTASALRIGFHPRADAGLRRSSASGSFYGLLGRVYFEDHGPFDPYVELGLGGGSLGTTALEADDVQYDETASGFAARVGLGLEFFLGPHLRVGPALNWTRFDVRQFRRCGGELCRALDEERFAHATGFTTLSLRLSIVLGPAS